VGDRDALQETGVRGYAVEGGKGMSKAVMISVRPKWCEKIIIGRKTMELRKSVPKLEVPFKCYIYCTSGHPYISVKGGNLDRDTVRTNTVGRCNGKVIGEFVCDYILQRCEMANADIAEQQSCVRREDIYFKYSEEGKHYIYGWHISNLKIYDTPKESSKFSRPFENCIDKVCDEFGCALCENGGHIKRAPQSWCYVEEQK
jgi:predicted transcriptional regulator